MHALALSLWLEATRLPPTTATASAQSAGVAATPIIDNERVIVWDLDPRGGRPDPVTMKMYDAVVVHLGPTSMVGKVEFLRKGTTLVNPVPGRTVVIGLKDARLPPLKNTSGYPDAFPRPGQNRKVLENAKVIVWDFTFAPGQATPMHFHDKDVVTIYLEPGTVMSKTPDGETTPNEFIAGTIRFNPRNRTHTETLVKGASHIITAEIK